MIKKFYKNKELITESKNIAEEVKKIIEQKRQKSITAEQERDLKYWAFSKRGKKFVAITETGNELYNELNF